MTKEKLDRKLEHLLLSTKLEDMAAPSYIKTSLAAVFFTFLCLFAWAYFSSINEITPAPGTVIPLGRIQSIQHLEGGIIQDILKRNDEVVTKGTTIISLNKEQVQSELQRLKSRENALQLNITRLENFIENKQLTEEELKNSLPYKEVETSKSTQSLIKHTLAFFSKQNLNKQNETEILNNKILKLNSTIESLNKQISNIESRIKILQEQHKIYKELDNTQMVSKLSLLDSVNRLKDMEGEALALIQTRDENLSLLNEAKSSLATIDSKYYEEALQELTDLTAELIETQKLIDKTDDRFKRLDIKSPILGIIKGLELSAGSIISPGQKIFEIVPLDENLIVEAKISTLDRGHVNIKDPVKVKVSSYDFATFGQIQGYVDSISASTFLDEDDIPYYKVIVKIDKNYLGDNPKMNKILPGMTVTADIITSEKSLLTYLLKPITRTLDNSFRER